MTSERVSFFLKDGNSLLVSLILLLLGETILVLGETMWAKLVKPFQVPTYANNFFSLLIRNVSQVEFI